MDAPIKDPKDQAMGFAIVVHRTSESYSSRAANGYAECASQAQRPARHGVLQHPGDRRAAARDHSHEANEEILFFFEGEGKVVIDGKEEHKLRAGTSVFLGPNRRHTFINTGDKPLKMAWVLMPGGLEDFFQLGQRVAGQKIDSHRGLANVRQACDGG
jgi:mannose-6-phosphate isomerase-like protein (cupin superfamily)